MRLGGGIGLSCGGESLWRVLCIGGGAARTGRGEGQWALGEGGDSVVGGRGPRLAWSGDTFGSCPGPWAGVLARPLARTFPLFSRLARPLRANAIAFAGQSRKTRKSIQGWTEPELGASFPLWIALGSSIRWSVVSSAFFASGLLRLLNLRGSSPAKGRFSFFGMPSPLGLGIPPS